MKAITFAVTLLSLLAFSWAWTPEDYEIFKINDANLADPKLANHTSWYSWVGVKPSASQKELNSAYRKQAGALHPDRLKASYVNRYKKKYDGKAPTKKQIARYAKEVEERSARFTLVGNILRGEGRSRYDHFLRHGFPKYRGTNYYYERYRPGTGTVLIGLFVMFGGVAHYGALLLSHKRHKEFVDRYIKHARKMAWGDSSGIAGIPGVNGNGNGNGSATGYDSPAQQEDEGNVQQWNRKARRMQEKESKRAGKNPKAARAAREKGISTPVEAELTSGPVGAKKRVMAQNGKVLIVDSVGNVFVEEETEEGDTIELLLDIDAIEKPTISDTFLVRAPLFLYRKSLGRLISPAETVAAELGEEQDETLEDAALNEATSINKNEEAERRQPKVRRR